MICLENYPCIKDSRRTANYYGVLPDFDREIEALIKRERSRVCNDQKTCAMLDIRWSEALQRARSELDVEPQRLPGWAKPVMRAAQATCDSAADMGQTVGDAIDRVCDLMDSLSELTDDQRKEIAGE